MKRNVVIPVLLLVFTVFSVLNINTNNICHIKERNLGSYEIHSHLKWLPPHPPHDTRGKRILLSDDFEGPGYWSGNFALTDEQSHSASHSMTDSPGGNYDYATAYYMVLAIDIDLTNAVNPTMEFWYYIDASTGDDGGFVAVSTDGGENWGVIQPSNQDNNYQMMSSTSALAQQGISYGYTGHSFGWVKAEFDLSPYVGTAQFRVSFNFVTTIDSFSSGGDGWYIDDVVIMADNTPPEAPVMITQGNHTESSAMGVVEDPVMLTWECTDPDGDIIRNYTIHVATVPNINTDNPSISDDAWILRKTINGSDFNTPADTYITVDVEDGKHYYWAIKASDGFDWGPWSQVYDFVTNRPPVANITSITPQNPKAGELVTFTGTASDPDGDTILKYKWESSIDGVLGWDSTITATLSEGSHIIHFYALDQNWEWSEAAESAVIVGENTAPEIKSFTPGNDETVVVTQGETKTFEVVVEDAETTDSTKLIKKWYLDDKLVDEGISYNLKTTVGGTLKDVHTLTFVVSDGVLSANVTWNIYINAIPQILSKTPNTDLVYIDELENVEFSVTAKDDNVDDSLHYLWYVDNVLQEGETSNIFTFYTDYNSSRGRPYYIKVVVYDDYNQQVKVEWNLIVNNVVQPVILKYWDPYGANLELEEGKTQIFRVSASSPDTTLSYYWYVDNENVGSGPMYIYTPSYEDAGQHTVQVVITDNCEDTEDIIHTWYVTVINVNRNPVAIITLPDLSTYEAGAGPIPFDASHSYDPDGDSITFKWYDEAGRVIGEKASFEKELSPGVRTITLEVTDSEGAKGIARKIVTVIAPDVVVDSITFDREVYYVNEGGAITLLISNQGNIPARDVYVTIYVNNETLATYILYISPGETEKLMVPWKPTSTNIEVAVEIWSPHEGVINTPSGKITQYMKPTVKSETERLATEKQGVTEGFDPLLLPLAALIVIILIIDAMLILIYKDILKLKLRP